MHYGCSDAVDAPDRCEELSTNDVCGRGDGTGVDVINERPTTTSASRLHHTCR